MGLNPLQEHGSKLQLERHAPSAEETSWVPTCLITAGSFNRSYPSSGEEKTEALNQILVVFKMLAFGNWKLS